MRDILIPFGTRPEIIKLSPVVSALVASGLPVRTVATGQHYQANLVDSFFDELRFTPDERWVLEGDAPHRLGAIYEKADREIETSEPALVLVLGDTNTVPAFCLAARRHRVPVAHLEAGLRSMNQTSIEEVNRKVAAVCASLHFAPTPLAASFLASEGIDTSRIRVVGNPVLDVLRERAITARPLESRAGVAFTAHRATNVDDPARLRSLVELARRLAADIGPVTFPVHPRTRARLMEAGLESMLEAPGLTALDPLPYGQMLDLVSKSQVVVTDSGGLQEEASWLGVPVVVLRRSTPRWEGVAAGTSILAGLDVETALAAAKKLCSPEAQQLAATTPCPYGDGHTATQVAELLNDQSTWDLLALEEPDLVNWIPSYDLGLRP